jgi:hypothetical protein
MWPGGIGILLSTLFPNALDTRLILRKLREQAICPTEFVTIAESVFDNKDRVGLLYIGCTKRRSVSIGSLGG